LLRSDAGVVPGAALGTLTTISRKAAAARGEQRSRPALILAPSPPALLTVADVARELRVCTATVYKLCAAGELAHVRVSNAIRVAPADLAAYLDEGRRGK
jgi:excisionase family DNA binding protein